MKSTETLGWAFKVDFSGENSSQGSLRNAGFNCEIEDLSPHHGAN